MRVAAIVFVSVLAGLVSQEPPAAGGARVDFTTKIAPILVQRCIECHGPGKQKGDLRLDARAFVFPQGEEDDWTVVAGKPDDSELIRRIGLPRDDDDVMPAEGELLSPAEQALMHRWVVEGASWPEAGDQAIAAALAGRVAARPGFDLPAVTAEQRVAIDTAIVALKQKGAVVQRIAADTEALDVNLALLRDKVGDRDLELLLPLAPVLVWLDLSRTAITDAAGVHLAALTQVRRLHVASTAVGAMVWNALEPLQQLEFLNAHSTGLDDAALPALGRCKRLRHVSAWNTRVTTAARQALQDRSPAIAIDLGDDTEARLRAAEQAIAAREARYQPVNTVCPVAAKAVDAAHTTLHEGRRIGFCCAKCKAQFLKDPARFAGKLPPLDLPPNDPAK